MSVLQGNVAGSIRLTGGGGGGDLTDVQVKTEAAGDYESVVVDGIALIDESSFLTDSDLTPYSTTAEIEAEYYNQDDVDELLEDKQDVLTAGDNITITNNVISASGGISFLTNEHVVGTWINGKTLYGRSFILPAAALNNSPYSFGILTSELDEVWIDARLTYIKTADNSGSYVTGVGYWNPDNNFDCRLQTAETYLQLQTWRSGGMIYQDGSVLSLLYTKS